MRLKELRKLYGVSQEKLAKEISVSRSTVAMWEAKKSQPDNETLSRIANFFNVTTDYLLGNEIETKEIKNARKITKKLYEEQDIDIPTIEEKLGTNYATFRTWYNGYGDFFNNANGLSNLANLFHVSLDYLLGRTDDNITLPRGAIEISEADMVKIPVYGCVSAGMGTFAEDNIIDYETADSSDLSYGEQYFYLRVKGDSMYPIFIEGDYILVQKQTTVDSGSYAIVLIDDEEGVVKKVTYGENWIELHSINPMYPIRRFEDSDVLRLRIIGLVKGIKRKF